MALINNGGINPQQNENVDIESTIASQVEAQDYSGYDPVEETPQINSPRDVFEDAYQNNEAAQYLGQSLTHEIGEGMRTHKGDDTELVQNKKLATLGSKITANAEVRDGWIEVDRALLGERDVFYPAEWQFKIKPASVETIRYWSTINEENPNSIDDVFDEILKTCLTIQTLSGQLPWYNVNSWDRFFFILLIREYTFMNGERKISFEQDCPNCEVSVTFELNATSLMYEIPDPSVLNYYNQGKRVWEIVPSDFELNTPQEIFEFYIPTREKDANIKAWLINKLQENKNAKVDQVFIKFLPWMLPKVSKDINIAKTQIRKAEQEFKSWDIDTFSFLNEVVDSITVTPGTNLITTCPSCGEEVTAPIQFPNGISDLFNVSRRAKTFVKKQTSHM